MNWLNWLSGKQTKIDKKWLQRPISSYPLLAIDLELTALKNSDITSIGWIKSEQQRVVLHSARYGVIRTTADLQQSPVIHGLIASDIEQGQPLIEMLETLLPTMHNCLCVFHHAQLDITTLKHVCQQHHLQLPQVPYIDTLLLEQYLFTKTNQPVPPSGLTLSACRQRYDLPVAPAHNALDDAMATLELLLAQFVALGLVKQACLDDLTHTGAINVL